MIEYYISAYDEFNLELSIGIACHMNRVVSGSMVKASFCLHYDWDFLNIFCIDENQNAWQSLLCISWSSVHF